MIGSKEAQREPLPDGTTVIFLNNKEIVIRSPLCRKQERPVLRSIRPEYRPGHRDEGVLPGPLGAA